MHLTVKPLHLLLFLGIMTVWGGNFAVAKIALEQMPPILLVAVRFALVAVLLLPFVKPPNGKFREILVLSFVLGTLHFSLMFSGLRYVDAATAAISIQLQVPFAALLAAIAFGERFGWRRTLGAAIAFVGVAIIAGEPRLQGHYGALMLVIGAALVWALASIVIKHLETLNGTQINAWMAAFATPQLFLASFLLEDGQWAAMQAADWRVYAAVVYQAVIVVGIGYGMWYMLLKRYDVNVAMPFTLLVPFFGVASGVVFLGESLTAALLVGGALTIAGVGVITVRRPRVAGPTTTKY